MSNQSDFQRQLTDAGVRHFSAREMFFKGASHQLNGLNTDPPRPLWQNGVSIAKVADELRERCGFSISVVSAYRSPKYNTRIGGASRSRHMQFDALDLRPTSRRSAHLRRMKQLILQIRREGFFAGGCGSYHTFLHIDTRGNNATWGNWSN